MLQPERQQDGQRHHRRTLSFNGFARNYSTDTGNLVFRSPIEDSPDGHSQANAESHHRPKRGKSSKKHLQKNQNWNETKEAAVKWIGQRAGGYRWMHSRAARCYNIAYDIIGISAIVFNVTSIALNVPYVVQCSSTYDWSKILAIIIAAVVTAVMGFQQFKDYGSVKAEHINSEANYQALYDTIKAQLEKNASDRQNADDFIEWITKQFSDLKGSSPIVPQFILNQYRRMIAGRHFADPEGIDEIVINHDDEDEDEEELNEIVVDSQPPKSGMLTAHLEDNGLKHFSAAERLAFERWNEQ